MDHPPPAPETTRVPTATFEAVAVELGVMTDDQVDECRALHRAMLDLGLTGSFPEVCLKRGVLTAAQVATVEGALGRRGDVTFPGYEILGKIAEGGMGAVYKARQISMDRPVALKVLLSRYAGDEAWRERFLREAHAVARLGHPNIVAGIDAGEVGGVCYFVME
ncbi:MAG: protein kinase domain-containing protein, partial [Arenimonas sp.]